MAQYLKHRKCALLDMLLNDILCFEILDLLRQGQITILDYILYYMFHNLRIILLGLKMKNFIQKEPIRRTCRKFINVLSIMSHIFLQCFYNFSNIMEFNNLLEQKNQQYGLSVQEKRIYQTIPIKHLDIQTFKELNIYIQIFKISKLQIRQTVRKLDSQHDTEQRVKLLNFQTYNHTLKHKLFIEKYELNYPHQPKIN
ncbi:hypothetical protein pb186bvf_020509 [Paramecium bursaria]